MYLGIKSFVDCVLVLQMLAFRVSDAMTRYGDPCFDDCIKYGSQYSCYKAEVSGYYYGITRGVFFNYH